MAYETIEIPLNPNDPNDAEEIRRIQDGRKQQELIRNEIINQEPFYKTAEQSKFLDYLGSQMYGGDPERDAYSKMLNDRMMGSDGSLAQAQLAQKMNANAAAGASAMGTNRGVINPALLAKQVSGITATTGQENIGQSAIDRSAENQANTGLYGAETQAAAMQKLKQQQYFATQLEQERQANIDRVKFLSGVDSEMERARNDAANRESQRTANLVSGLGQGLTSIGSAYLQGQNKTSPIASTYKPMSLSNTGSSVLTMPETSSDIKLKDNISNGDPKMQEFLDSMQPYSYNYKNPKQDDNFDHLGVMAQDVEKTSLGKKMVKEGERGKMLKPDLSTILAAAAYNNKRLKELEGKVEGRSPAQSVKYQFEGDATGPQNYTGPRLDDKAEQDYYNQVTSKIENPSEPYQGIKTEPREYSIGEMYKNVVGYPESNVQIPYSAEAPVIHPAEASAPKYKGQVTLGKPSVSVDVARANVPPYEGFTKAMQPAPQDMKKVADYLDMMGTMKRAKTPMPEKFKQTRK